MLSTAREIQSKQRFTDIDVMKGILVIGMLYSHINVFYGMPSVGTTILKTYVNAVSFSGFLFCFGMTFSHAYLDSQKANIKLRILIGAVKIYGAFVLSSITYSMFRDKVTSWDRFFEILSLEYIPLYCEFLVTFFALYISTAVFFPIIRLSTASFMRLSIAIIVCMIPVFFVSPSTHTFVGIVWGIHGKSLFPLLPYTPFFLIGIAVTKHFPLKSRYIWTLCCVATSVSIAVGVITKSIPARFPPSFLWLVGPALPLLCTFYISRWIALHRTFVSSWLAQIGTNVLFYLVTSNIGLFAFTRMKYGFSLGGTLIVTITFLVIIGFLGWLVRPSRPYA
ncbi:MAG: hypothetical protein RLY87_2559 [Chloroflexota bacterium]